MARQYGFLVDYTEYVYFFWIEAPPYRCNLLRISYRHKLLCELSSIQFRFASDIAICYIFTFSLISVSKPYRQADAFRRVPLFV